MNSKVLFKLVDFIGGHLIPGAGLMGATKELVGVGNPFGFLQIPIEGAQELFLHVVVAGPSKVLPKSHIKVAKVPSLNGP